MIALRVLLPVFHAAEPTPEKFYRIEASNAGVIHQGTDEAGIYFEYWAGIPPTYRQNEPAPAIAFFHCRGWGQNALRTNILEETFEDFRSEAFLRGYLLLGITYGENSWMNAKGRNQAMAAIMDAKSRYAIDPERFYGMGLSMGGCGVMVLSKHQPGLFKALCNLCGIGDYTRFFNDGKYQQRLPEALGGTPSEVPEAYQEISVTNYPEAFLQTPVIILHGSEDQLVAVEQSRNLYRTLKETGVLVEYYEVPGFGHDSAIIKRHEKIILDFFEHVLRQQENHPSTGD